MGDEKVAGGIVKEGEGGTKKCGKKEGERGGGRREGRGLVGGGRTGDSTLCCPP